MAAPAAENSARGQKSDTTFTLVISRSVLLGRFNTPSCTLMDSTNEVHCYHYISTQVRGDLRISVLLFKAIFPCTIDDWLGVP